MTVRCMSSSWWASPRAASCSLASSCIPSLETVLGGLICRRGGPRRTCFPNFWTKIRVKGKTTSPACLFEDKWTPTPREGGGLVFSGNYIHFWIWSAGLGGEILRNLETANWLLQAGQRGWIVTDPKGIRTVRTEALQLGDRKATPLAYSLLPALSPEKGWKSTMFSQCTELERTQSPIATPTHGAVLSTGWQASQPCSPQHAWVSIAASTESHPWFYL